MREFKGFWKLGFGDCLEQLGEEKDYQELGFGRNGRIRIWGFFFLINFEF